MLKIWEFAKTGELFDGRYRLLRTLSTEGGSADVWLAVDTLMDTSGEDADGDMGGIQVAIKIYRPKNALDIEGEQKFREEYKIVYNCHHANLLQPTNFSIFKETPYLVLPYCRKGSAERLIGQDLAEDELWKFIRNVASGLAYLHANTPPIIHQDIKPANVLIDENNNYAITDFGISAQSGGRHEYYGDEYSGTFAYMAPERFVENPEPMAASDIWAFGATLYELITGHAPFGDDGGQAQDDGKVVLNYQGKNIPQAIKKMIAACLDKNPDKRPTAEELEESARQKKFPAGKSIAAKLSVGVLLCAVIAIFVWALSPKEMPPTNKEVYNAYVHLMDSDNPDSLKLGITKMDSLANMNYIPAMEQLFFTYGWYSDEKYKRRKHLLGISVTEEGWPSDSICDKAASYLNRIIESDDSVASPSSKAEANYRLAAYKLDRGDTIRAKKLLQTARPYAQEAGDTALTEQIERSLESFIEY